jgi:hypothetical protein
MTKRRTCDDCNPLWDRKLNVKAIQLCPLHAAAPALLEALEAALPLLHISPDITEEAIRAVCEAANKPFEKSPFCAYRFARAAIKTAKGT